jgi:FKBP-type peptidyl-prolyl cis-trans isomerase (trigger factor)
VIKALQDNNVDVTSTAQEFNLSYGINKPIDVTANFKILQDLNLPDLSTITVEKRAILDEVVEFHVEDQFKKYIKFQSAELRPTDENYQIKPNDKIIITTRVFCNDKEVMLKKEKLLPIKLTILEPNEGEDEDQLFIGRKLGETVEQRVKVPESDKNRAIAGKEVVQKYKIEEVLEYVPIPVDKYIDDMGDPQIKTPDDLKAFIREGVLIELEKDELYNRIYELIKKIAEHTEIAIRNSELESTFLNIVKNNRKFGIKPPTDLSFIYDENKLMLPENILFLPYRNQAIYEIQETYIARHVARKQNFPITDEDVKDFVIKFLKSQGSEINDEIVDSQLNLIKNNKNSYNLMEDAILRDKAIAWLLDHVNIVELSPEETLARSDEMRNASEKYKQKLLEAINKKKSDEETSKANNDQKLNMENETSDSPIEKDGEENPPSPQEESTPSNEKEE